MPLNGIDVSNWQKTIWLDRLPKLDLAIFKASQGTQYPDAYFEGFMQQAIDLGVSRLGAYWWVETHEDVKPQLDVFLRKVEPYLDRLTLFVDWEPRSPERVGTCIEAVSTLKAATGKQPHVYMNHSTANRYQWQPVRDLGCWLWLAQYANTLPVDGFQETPWHQVPSGWEGRVLGLQYTDKGRLPGFDGSLDLNRFWSWPVDVKPEPPKTTDPKETPVTNRTIRGFKVSEDAFWSFLALEELAVLKGWCKRTLDIYQGTGYSSLSGGTHAPPGGAMDFWQSSNPRELLKAARNGGFPGWHRTPAQGFGHHVHAGTNLPGRPYSYQLTALKAGYNGLGSGGYGGKDDGPRDGVQFRNWKAGLEWLRAEIEKEKAKIEKEKAKQKAPATADAPAAPRAIQALPDYWNPWLAVDAWDNANPDDATLTGLSDVQLRELFIAHGFMFYNRGSLHEDMRFTLADFAAGLALENIPRNPDEVAWDLLQQITRPITGVTWVELRPVFDAAHAGGSFGQWGEDRTRHSVRAVQAGLNHLSGATLIPEDGIYSTVTRTAVANFQVAMRGATPGTPAADGVVGLHDALHLVRMCSERVGRPHRLRFVY